MLSKLFKTDSDYVLTIMRLLLGIIFFVHGAQKTLGWFGGHGFHGTMEFFTHQLNIPVVFAFLAICAEFLGGIGLILGCLTRIAALGIGFEMAVAVLMIHRQFGFFMNWSGAQKGEGYEYHLLVFAIATALLVKGGGALSLDRALSRESG